MPQGVYVLGGKCLGGMCVGGKCRVTNYNR